MGKAEFYSIDFNAFQNVFFTDVHLVDCSFINVKWNYNIKSFKGRRIHQTDYEKSLVEKIKRIENNAEDDFVEIEELKIDQTVIEYYVKLREVFRQLKYSLSKQGDIIHEQKFHTKEMLAYNRSLRYPDNGWTKAIIKMSYWFSDFGQSFNRPFWALLIGHWLLFVILLSLNNYHDLQISLYKPTWEGFELAFERYWQLINPFRKADFNFDGYKIIIDILMRIWSSYMIYNMIRATRRFIK